MRAVHQYDEELVSVSTVSDEQRMQKTPWKTVAVSLCATMAVAGYVLMPGNRSLHTEETDGLVVLAEKKCSKMYGEDCWDTRCCVDEGYVCVMKNSWWASCRPKADAVPGFVDSWDNSTWNGSILEPLAGGDKACLGDTDDCTEVGCCKTPGYSCFVKNEHYANCNASCTIGISPTDPVEHQTPWSCEIVDLSSHDACTLTAEASMTELKDCCKKSQCGAEALKALGGVDEATCVASKCSAYDSAETTTTGPQGTTAVPTTVAPA